MQQQDAKELLKKYREGTATEAEKTLLGDWVLFGKLKELDLTGEELDLELSMIGEGLPLYKQREIRLWPRIAAAASILFILSAGGYFLFHKAATAVQIAQVQDIAPGSNKAILTLSNGKQISLTDARNGTLARQSNAIIHKTADGQIVYSADQLTNQPIVYNTITTPRGGKYSLTLADGTIAILDAASSIKYPVAFTGNDRTVAITGQVYFEVVHNASKPFRVTTMGQTIEDIGTHFNINAYNDEPVIKITLLEGSIRISKGSNKAILKPGQQAITVAGTNTLSVKDVDTEEAIAWKNGYFLFDNESMESVMRKVSRWYDVDIEYPPGQKVNENYWGSITRYGNVSKVLNMLEATGDVRFKVEGKKIIVLKK